MKALTLTAGSLVASTLSLLFLGCETETPTRALVDNAYPMIPDGGDSAKEVVVYKGWYTSTVFLDPVNPGQQSDAQRTVPGSDYAYAVLAVGWDPGSMTPPTRLIPIRSSAKVSVARGDTLSISVSDGTFVGDCGAGKPLSQDDADFITQRIFPGDFSSVQYDARTCTATPLTVDGGADDAGMDGPSDAGGDASNSGG